MKKVVLAIVVVLIVIVAYFFLFQQNLFSQGIDSQVNALNQIWLDNGINVENLSDSQMANVSLSQLNSIQNSLTSFKAKQSNKTVLDLADIHLALVQVLKEKKALSDSLVSLQAATEEDACNNLSALQAMASKSNAVYEKAVIVDEKIDSFSSNYPNAVSIAYLNSLKTNSDTIKENNDTTNDLIEQLREWC